MPSEADQDGCCSLAPVQSSIISKQQLKAISTTALVYMCMSVVSVRKQPWSRIVSCSRPANYAGIIRCHTLTLEKRMADGWTSIVQPTLDDSISSKDIIIE